MNKFMSIQIGTLSKGLITSITFVGFYSCVNEHVLLEAMGIAELQFTHRAFGFIRGVSVFFVMCEVLL